MPSDSNEAFGDEDDHLLAGTNFLRRIGHNIDKTLTASAGLDEDGHPQVLVIGFNNIQLVNEKGKVVLDVGSRNIRALRSVNTGGLQLCTTTNVATENFRTRWPHYISVEDAQYLENLWLDLFPLNHAGPQLNSLPWREEEYAYYVGRVVTEAAKCDVALAGLATTAHLILGRSPEKIHGQSGKALKDKLTEIGEHCKSPIFSKLGERYYAWYDKRNFATHGIRGTGADGHPTGQVFKHKKGTQPSEVYTEVDDQDFQQLALIWRAFYDLNHDAFEISFHLGFYNSHTESGTPEEFIGRTPLSSTGTPDSQMPWQ